MELVLECSVTCPECGAVFAARMPDAEEVVSLSCPTCERVIKPEPGDCCVFCSHGSVPCPKAQSEFLAMIGS